MRTSLPVLLVGLLLAGAAHATDPAPAPAPATTPANMPIPATYADVVVELRAQATGLDGYVAKGSAAELRTGAKRIIDLAGAIAGRSSGLSAEAQADAKTVADRIRAKANEILAATDKNEMPAVKTAIGAMKTDIELLANHIKK